MPRQHHVSIRHMIACPHMSHCGRNQGTRHIHLQACIWYPDDYISRATKRQGKRPFSNGHASPFSPVSTHLMHQSDVYIIWQSQRSAYWWQAGIDLSPAWIYLSVFIYYFYFNYQPGCPWSAQSSLEFSRRLSTFSDNNPPPPFLAKHVYSPFSVTLLYDRFFYFCNAAQEWHPFCSIEFSVVIVRSSQHVTYLPCLPEGNVWQKWISAVLQFRIIGNDIG